ncbi:E3 ubiquitin-protein ligase DZIP3 [Stylophora pistillata]|uniref:E3 ubiquitin-protein ligase DZIP3 n=1 Tax=Stylophora pistillata TaxID=50429 RepID=A0A2B4RV28_STYPI|nr:E3 ubiquitin-protein ligase DZIP3 [Stylophora pistillata]
MASIDDAEDALRSTTPKANFHRLTRLLMHGGVQLLRETFESIHSPADLPVKLADPTIQAQLRKARLTQPERNRLYPSPGVYGKSSDFDITLIFKLFKKICNLTPPPGPRGWDDLPNSTDQTRVADLVRIKYYRNVIYGHHHTMEISDIEFVRLWGKISEALLRIATHISPAKRDEWKKSIDDLCHNPLTPDEERCIEELETWYKRDMDVKNELEKLTDTMEEKLNTLHEELTGLRSQRPVFVVIQMNVESNTQTLPTQAGYHQAVGSEPMFIVLNLPEPEQVVGAGAVSPDDPGPSNPQDIDVWNVILSFKESVDLFLTYLWCKLQLLVRVEDRGETQSTFQASISRATSERSIEPEKLSDLVARISRLEQENVKMKEKVEANEQIFQSERDNGNYWRSKIEKENNELKRLVEAKEHDHERRLHWLEMMGSKLEDELRQNWLSREEPYEKEPRQLQSRPRTYPGGIGRSTGWNYEVTKGFCQVIINRTTHEGIVGKEDEIVSVFQSLGYDVDKATSTANDDVKQLVKPIAARDYDNSDIFVCFILSNLTENLEIVSSKGGAFGVIDLMTKFSPRNCLSLSEKPKVFIFLVHQKAAAPATMYSVARNVPFPGMCLFVPYRKGYLSTLLTEIKSRASDLDLLSILEEAKRSFYQKNNITIPDPVHNFPKKVFLCRKEKSFSV